MLVLLLDTRAAEGPGAGRVAALQPWCVGIGGAAHDQVRLQDHALRLRALVLACGELIYFLKV